MTTTAKQLSGTYVDGPKAKHRKLTLRVEVKEREVLVSGDLVRGNSNLSFNCVGVKRPTSWKNALSLDIKESSGPLLPGEPQLTLTPRPGELESTADLVWNGNLWTCTKASDLFRDLVITQARDSETRRVVNLSHSAIRDLRSAYELAGVSVRTPKRARTVSQDPTDTTHKWSPQELRDVVTGILGASAGAAWKVVLVHARAYVHDDYVGVMFDDEGDHQRQGCAVFYDKLNQKFGEEHPRWRRRAALFTCVHEVAHCLNLDHVPEASWMLADPFKGTPRDPFQGNAHFREEHLEKLHHGLRKDVIPGGTPFAGVSPGAAAVKTPVHKGLALRVRCEKPTHAGTRPTYVPYEPVYAALKLYVDNPRAFQNAFGGRPSLYRPRLESGAVRIFVTGPDQKRRRIWPRWWGTAVQLEAPYEDEINGLPWYESVYVGYGRDGFYFANPGTYKIEAEYQLGKTAILDETIIEVASGNTAIEQIQETYQDPDVAKLFAEGGTRSGSVCFEKARGNLRELSQRYMNQPSDGDTNNPSTLALYAHYINGLTLARPFFNGERTLPPDDAAVDYLKALTERFVRAGAAPFPIDYLRMDGVFRQLAVMYARQGDGWAGAPVRNTLDSYQSAFPNAMGNSKVQRRITAKAAGLEYEQPQVMWTPY